MSGLHSLATIIKRLEAATSRIEDIAASQGRTAPSDEPGQPYSAPPPLPPPSQAAAPKEDPRSVVAYDQNVVDGKLKPFVELTASFAAPVVVETVGKFDKLFQDQRAFLHRAATCQKPDQKPLEQLLMGVQKSIEDVQRFKEANRKERDWYNHITVISEGAIAVAWLAYPKPGPHIAEIKDTVTYNGNKIIKEFKEKDAKHVEWVRAFTGLLEELRKYVMEFHTTGVSWNPRGIPNDSYSAPGAAPPTGAAPPPPPPPPPGPPPPPVTAAPTAPAGGAAAVFAEINRGDAVTQGLRKVDKSEMTHKNPALRGSSVVPASTSTSPPGKKPARPSKPQALMGKKPPKLALEAGNKWAVEYQENETGLTLEDVQINHVVNLFACKNSTIVIKGKVNAVTLVNCVKTQVLVDSVVSSISVTNSPSFTVQVTGKAPMLQLDSTDVGQIYLSKESLEAEITTAKCSSINVSLPVEGEEDGVFEEQPVPEMLKTTVVKGKLVTTVVEHVGEYGELVAEAIIQIMMPALLSSM